jgi:prepilin peptidase CpaA
MDILAMTQFLSGAMFPLLLAYAGIGDLLTYRIPNWLTGLMAALFVPMALFTGMPPEVGLWHLGMGAALLIVGFALYAFGMFGGGDAKLIAVVGLWFGWPASLPFLTYTALAGGVLAIAVLLYSMVWLEGEVRAIGWLKKLTSLRPSVPYGLAIAAGAILAFPQSWWMQAAYS